MPSKIISLSSKKAYLSGREMKCPACRECREFSQEEIKRALEGENPKDLRGKCIYGGPFVSGPQILNNPQAK